MFGIGFTELLLISIIAILFLGPDKLPDALVEMAKFIKSVKKTISEAKGSLEEEMKIADLKEEALGYKKQLDDATSELKGFKNLSLDDLEDESYDDEISTQSASDIVKATNKKETTKVETSQEEPSQDTQKDSRVATQVEAKNETVTFKKLPKKEKIDTEGKA